MRTARRRFVRILLMMPFTVTLSAAGGTETLPEKGAVLYVSRSLRPQSGPPRAGNSTAAYATGGTDMNPITSGDGTVYNSTLQACEPVEVRKAKSKSIKVRWLRDGQTISTLGHNWRNDVHRSQEDCMDAVKLKRGQ